MPATKLCTSYADLRHFKIPKIKRPSEQSGEMLSRAEEQFNRSPEKAAPTQQSPRPQEGTPEKAAMTARPQKFPGATGSLGGKPSAKGLIDQIMEGMDKSYLKVTHPKSPFRALSRRESDASDPACQRSPAKRPLVQDSGNTVSRTAPTPPPEKRTSFGVPLPRSWEQPRQLCIVCRRRSVSDSGLRDTCIRCSFSQGFHAMENREESVVRNKPASTAAKRPPSRPPEPPPPAAGWSPPAKPSSRRDSSDVENRRERVVRPRQDSGAPKLDGSGTETSSSSPVRKHGCDRRKRAVRKLFKTKAVISSSDESSDAEKDSMGTAPSSLGEKRSTSAAASPRKGGQDGRARPTEEKREPHLLREKNENSDSSSTAVPKPSQDKKVGSSSSTVAKKKQKGSDKGCIERRRQKYAWKKAKDTADYLKVLSELRVLSHEEAKETAKDEAKDRAREGTKDDADDEEEEEEESVEAVLACLRQTEREKLANTTSSQEAGPDTDKAMCNNVDIVTNHLKPPASPALVVASCRSLSVDDWEKMQGEVETRKDSAPLHRKASVNAAMPVSAATPDTVVIVASSDSSSLDMEACPEQFNYNFRGEDSSSMEVVDLSSDTSEGTSGRVVLGGLSYEVSYSEDGTQYVRVREKSSSKEKLLSSSEEDTVEVPEQNCGSMVPGGFVMPVSHRDAVSSNGEGTAKEGLDGQLTVAPLVSVSSTAESASTETPRDVCTTMPPLAAVTTEESASAETPCEVRAISSSVFASPREEDTANGTLRNDPAVALPCSTSQLSDVLPSEETVMPAFFPEPNQELLSVGDQTLSALSELSITIEGEAGSESSPSFEDRPLLVQRQQQGLRATAGSSDASSAEWDPLRAVEELFPRPAGPDSPCGTYCLLEIAREYMDNFERFFAAFRSYTPEGQVAMVDDLLKDGTFAKLWRIIQLLWHFQATSQCISRGRIKNLEDTVCSMLAQGIARLGPTLTASDLPAYMSFEAPPPEPLQQQPQQSASPLGTEVGPPSQEQVVEVDPGLSINSMETSEVQPDAVAAPEMTGRPKSGQTPEAVVEPIVEDASEVQPDAVAAPERTGRPKSGQTPEAVVEPILEDVARQTPQSPVEGGLSETRLGLVLEGAFTRPAEFRRTPAMEAALSSADPPRVLEQVTTVDTSQVAETRESPPCVRASTWHPPIAYQEVARANGSRAGLTRVPETDRSPEAASESGSAGVNRNASSKVAPMLTSSNVPARNQILVQVRNTKHIPQARIAPQNQPPPPPPPPPLQQGRPAAGTQQAATGALVRVEIREPPPLQRAPNRPAMPQQQLQELQPNRPAMPQQQLQELQPNRSALSQQQLQELQCQLAAYTYVTSMLNTRVRSEDQQQANPTDGPQPLPLNLAKQQPENAASLKCMPPLQYMPPGARPQARPSEVNNQQALLQLQSSQGSPRMPQLLPPSSANQPSVSAEERSQRPPANRVVAIQPMQALAPAQTSVELELQRRQYIELLLRYNFGRSLGDRQEAHRALQAFLATRNESMRASAPANQALPGAMDSGYQHQQRPGSTVEKSSSHQSLMRVTIPSGNAPSSGVERQGHTAADATRHAGSSLPQRRPQPVRPWCDESPQQPQRSRWPPPYASCQEAVLRYKQQQQQQQRGAEAVSRSAMPSVAESNSSLSERPSTSGQSSPMHGSSAQQNQEASSQPAVVRSSPEQGCAAMPSGSLQGRRGAPRAVVPNNHSAYQRFLDAFCGSSSVLLSQEGVVVLSTSNVSGPRSEAVAGQRRLPQAPHTAADARPPDTQLPR